MTIRYAVLDARDVLVGYEDHPEPLDPVPDDRVEVPSPCDLALRRYRWNREAFRFDPISLRLGGVHDGTLPVDRPMLQLARVIDSLARGRRIPDDARAWAAEMLAAHGEG